MLLLSAAGIAILLYVVVQSVAEQIAQESQDNILAASAISILDSARVVEGDISIDLPYSSLSMLDSVTDERAFYAIRLNDEFLSGYPDLPVSRPQMMQPRSNQRHIWARIFASPRLGAVFQRLRGKPIWKFLWRKP